jgi:hypothetical protein
MTRTLFSLQAPISDEEADGSSAASSQLVEELPASTPASSSQSSEAGPSRLLSILSIFTASITQALILSGTHLPFDFFSIFSPKRSKRTKPNLLPVIKTSTEDKNKMAEQWARVFYANRLPFHVAENKEFKKALEMMRPGIGKNLFSQRDLAGKHLTNEHDKIDDVMKSSLSVN